MLDVPVRLYGVACLSLSALFLIVSIINTDNRRAIRIALFVEAMYFVIGILGEKGCLNQFLVVFLFATKLSSVKLWLVIMKLQVQCPHGSYEVMPMEKAF